jgi:pimeloyl-ACP methyl ester carboxylesterase
MPENRATDPTLRWAYLLVLLAVSVFTTDAQSIELGTLKVEPYVFQSSKGDKVEAELGRLTVPENRRKANGRTVEIAFVRFRSTGTGPNVPTVYLAGGLGGSGIGTARGSRFPLFMAMREFGDVIALDQRGTGMSKPNLACTERFDFPIERPGIPGEMIATANERARSCGARLRGQGIDLSAYNTEENADDIEALRVAIGADKINLWSISYGTHLALAYTKRHPTGVARAIMAGVNGLDDRRKLPSDAQRVLERIGEYVKADPELSTRIPNFLSLVKNVFQKLESQPVTVEVDDPQSKQKVKVGISKLDLQFLIAQGLGSSQSIRSLPLLFLQMSEGRYESIGSQVLWFRRSVMPSAMYFAMDCASGGSKARYAQIKREEAGTLLGNAFNFMIADSCEAWDVADLGDSFRKPVTSKVPVLFISGTLDGRTPPERAEEVRKGFRNSTHLIIDGASHDDDLFLSTPKIMETMLAFMRGEKLSGELKYTATPTFAFRKPN